MIVAAVGDRLMPAGERPADLTVMSVLIVSFADMKKTDERAFAFLAGQRRPLGRIARLLGFSLRLL